MKDEEQEESLLNKDFMEFPKELDKKCTKEEFHKMMTSHNSDIPIETVKFINYPDIN
jgi:Ca2+-binding EF-hand superfamily protein